MSDTPPAIGRRAILAAFGAVALAHGLAACASSEEEGALDALSEELRLHPELARFLHLSALLTGFDRLEPSFAQLYLHSLQSDAQRAADLERLYQQAGYRDWHAPASLEELESRGIFRDGAFRILTDRIITNWYTGLYEAESGMRVATYVRALGWRLDGINAPTTRGGPPGFWSRPPVVREIP
ncbi:sorbitol dehydrogenase family protein [Pendulispora brunnea]|uniref:Sorbitol dehydrogenase family protein n=1 Tax=Pendulispora brunnea TaxID=2905690 RepID=A0ABZ2K5V2_9BACT